MGLSAGMRLGPYEIVGPLGAGGMGEVYRARDTRLGRQVAVKILPDAVSQDPRRVARFETEARALAALSHPNILAIHDFGQSDGRLYAVTELLEGETLRDRMTGEPPGWRRTAELAAAIADGLASAHAAGIVHRDLKPENVFLTSDGRVKILDFGLAKSTEPVSEDAVTLASPSGGALSSGSEVVGTLSYMAPEQLRGQKVDGRTDIFALGCVLFEMLSGKRPFTGISPADTVSAILHGEPGPVESVAPATPPVLAGIVSRCLEKRPEDRFDTAHDVAIALRSISGEQFPVSRSGGRRRPARRRRIVAAAAVVGAIAVVTIFLAVTRRTGAPPLMPDRKQLVLLPPENLSGSAEWQRVCDGFAATVSARLHGIPELGVVTPAEFLRGSDPGADIYGVARSLGANLLLQTSFQRAGDRIRVTWTTLDIRGRHVAAGTLDGSDSDLFDLQDRFSEAVTKALRLSVPTRPASTTGALAPGSEQQRYVDAMSLLARYDRRESVEKAFSILSGLASERPDAPLVQTAVARTCLALYDLTNAKEWADKAFAAAEAARTLDPRLTEVDVVLGETLLKTGRAKEAVEAFRRALSTQPDSYDALLGLGRGNEAAGDDAAAEEAFRRAINLQPLTWAGYNQNAAFYYHRGRYKEAANLFRKATELTPDNYRAWSNLGGASTMQCEFDPALEAFQKALSLRPNNAVAASNFGLTQLWTGRYAEAVESLETAARYGPTDSRIWVNLGDAYGGAGRKEKAAEAYERCRTLAREQLRQNPKDAQALEIVAISLAKTGRVAEAQEPIRQALAIDPKDPAILADAAIVAVLAGRTSEALDWIRQAVEAGYCPLIIERQPEFKSLRTNPVFRQIVRGSKPT